MLTIDRIHTKEFFIKRGVKLQNILIGCPWCERIPERANHLFFKCKFIEGFWYKIFNWWEAEWESVEGFDEFYTLCYNMKLVGIRKSLWLISISTACWTVWLCPPSEGCLKFNVCGIANDDSAGCEGVLRDMEGVARALFSDIERKIEKVGSVVFSMEDKKGNEMKWPQP
ncbi:hypothetical protein Golax_022773 [Gossypium laxum]|uniref:Reverse transcriptase zinc-binding domain-containing protein n=1 Tax=Gossypium laxum TaxID=34288 RepID=A0A7J9B0T3_9ROSI|nr:hypothetical protein [Gossypium laxum]